MVHEPAYVLLIAVALALVLPQPGRVNPFVAVGPVARALARDLPKNGPWAAPAGILLLVLIAAPAVAVAWALTSWLPQALRVFAPDASPIVALILSAIVLRLTFSMPPVWAWRRHTTAGSPREEEGRPRGSPLRRIGAELVAPVMLSALLGMYAPVAYRVALGMTRGLTDPTEDRIAAAAGWVAYIAAYPAGWLGLLFALVAARRRVPAGEMPGLELTLAPESDGSLRACVIAGAGSILLALLVAVW